MLFSIKSHLKKKKKQYIFFILFSLIVGLIFFFLKESGMMKYSHYKTALFIIWILGFLIVEWDSRISIAIALLFLISCPVLLILKEEALAERMAIFAYAFLVCGVIAQIKECFKEKKEKCQE